MLRNQTAQGRSELTCVLFFLVLIFKYRLLVSEVKFQAKRKFDRFQVNGEDLDATGVAE